MIALSSAPTKRVFAEEGTGTWCSWCPRGTVYMDSMKTKYPNTFIGVAVHGGFDSEPMRDSVYATGMTNNNFGSFPGIAVDRQPIAKGVDPNVVESFYKTRVAELSPIEINLSDVHYNSTSRVVTYKVNAIPAASINVTWNFNSVIYENDVTWSDPTDSSRYQQSNYYAGGVYGPMGGYEKKHNPVWAKDMHYNIVARRILDGFLGLTGSFPASVTDGTTYSKTYSFTLPDNYDANQVYLIGLVTDASTKEVLNVAESDHEVSWYPVGISENPANKLNLYPNPTTGIVHLSSSDFDKAEVYNILGKLILTERNPKQLDLSSFANGTYIVRIFDQKQNVITNKIVLNK